MIAKNQIINELDFIQNEYFQEILDFLEYLKHKQLKKIPETMLLSEKSLAKNWDTPEEDAAWTDL